MGKIRTEKDFEKDAIERENRRVAFKDLLDSPAWLHLNKYFKSKIEELGSLNGIVINGKTPEEVFQDVSNKKNKMNLYSSLKSYIENEAEGEHNGEHRDN